jgi:hypothetical protein
MAEVPKHNGRRTATPKANRPRRLAVAEADPGLGGYTEHQKRIADQMVVLRLEFQEAVACYSVRVQSLLTQLGDMLAEDAGHLSPLDRRSRERVLQRALAGLDRLDLKPAKGRRRDLKAVELFAEDVSDAVADW